jgi:hypothetical protein
MFTLACFGLPVGFSLMATGLGFWRMNGKNLPLRAVTAALCLGAFATAYWFEFIFIIIPVYYRAGGGE